jgi:phage shock protein A
MNIFRRFYKIGEAEANSAIDKMEDPIKMIEQGIRDLKNDLSKSLEALAQVKAAAIRAGTEEKQHLSKAEDYQNKAMAILQKAQSGSLAEADADRLAGEALTKQEELKNMAGIARQEQQKLEKSISELEHNVQKLKSTISSYENELKTLKSRVKVSKAKGKLNKQMAQIDSTGTVSMLERMRDKVNTEEALAEAYGDIATSNTSIEDEINKAADMKDSSAKSRLDELKKQMGINAKTD